MQSVFVAFGGERRRRASTHKLPSSASTVRQQPQQHNVELDTYSLSSLSGAAASVDTTPNTVSLPKILTREGSNKVLSPPTTNTSQPDNGVSHPRVTLKQYDGLPCCGEWRLEAESCWKCKKAAEQRLHRDLQEHGLTTPPPPLPKLERKGSSRRRKWLKMMSSRRKKRKSVSPNYPPVTVDEKEKLPAPAREEEAAAEVSNGNESDAEVRKDAIVADAAADIEDGAELERPMEVPVVLDLAGTNNIDRGRIWRSSFRSVASTSNSTISSSSQRGIKFFWLGAWPSSRRKKTTRRTGGGGEEATQVAAEDQEEDPDEQYEGQFNSLGQRHGRGVLIHLQTGHRYEGEFQHGQRHGRGTLTWAVRHPNADPSVSPTTPDSVNSGGQYDGQFRNDMMEGKGCLTWPGDDKSYVGDFKENLPHGHGILSWASDGRYYDGEFVAGQMHGFGTFAVPKQQRQYAGYFAHNKKHGKGTYTLGNGEVYEGNYVNDQKSGYGTYKWPDGSSYRGDWANGKAHGQGVYTDVDGEVFEGGFANDQMHGHGVRTLRNGRKVTEEWRDGKKVFNLFESLRALGANGKIEENLPKDDSAEKGEDAREPKKDLAAES